MTTLTLIGEPLAELEANAQAAAVRELAEAVAQIAPRGCSSRLIVARDANVPKFESSRASVETMPLNTGALPFLWRSGFTARPLDGEFVHANTPLVPLRSRIEDDGSQTSVVVPHMLAWQAPELMGAEHSRNYKAFVRRATRLADVVLAPNHSVADQLHEAFDVETRVLPLAAPAEYLASPDSAELRRDLGLPKRYIATTALPGVHGRLEWLLDALAADATLPALAVIQLGAETPAALTTLPPALTDRVHLVTAAEPETLARVGAVISGARLLALPQEFLGAGFEVFAALTERVPVLHSGSAVALELALDAGVTAASEAEFATALDRLCGEQGAAEMSRLCIHAEDRSQTFSWRNTAWQLWELHADI